MNLEIIEQKTLHYLKQVSNPLVQINVLHAYLTQFPDSSDLGRDDLIDFLERHELFKVLYPPEPPDPSTLADDDLLQPSVILETRIPGRDALAAMMLNQMDTMLNALATALREARDADDASRIDHIRKMMDRAASFRSRLLGETGVGEGSN